MKRLFTLFVLICMAVGIADVAVAQDAPSNKTRYVYVWDVTASIKGKENSAKGLYKSMFDFFSRDVGNKPANAEIVVVPFNDKVLESEIRTFSKDQFNVDEMRILGDTLIERHRGAFRENPGDAKINPEPNPYKGGFTDIAAALYYVSENYFKGDCKTYYILLTDCGQEYVHEKGSDPYINLNDKPAAQKRLQNALTHINRTMHEHNSQLTYVLFDDDDPRDGASDSLETDRINFIDASDVSKNHIFCDISASVDFEVMSSRDVSYEIELDITDGYALPRGMQLVVNDGKGEQKVAVTGDKVEIPCKNRYKVSGENEQISLQLEAILPGDNGEVEDGANVYHYSFVTSSLRFEVANNFMPSISVKTNADCANWGMTEYYSSAPLCEYEPVVMEQDITVRLNPDACKLFAGKGKVTFYVSASDDEFEQPEDVIMYYNGEECDDFYFTVDLSGAKSDDTEYEVEATLGFEFTERAHLDEHTLYIGYEDFTESIGDNYNKEVSIPGIRDDHEVIIEEDLKIKIDKDLSEDGIVIIKTEKMNPLVKGLMWILIVLVTIFILSIILSRMMTQKIQVPAVTLVGESGYYKRLTTRGYQKVVLTSKRKKQGFFNKLYKGTILYEVNEVWTSDVTFEPRNTRKKSLHIGYNVSQYTCDASILERSNSYKLTDLTTKKKTEITLS
ncbi:MAG: hypothetical protein J6C56_03850 [Alistipes sp.]|nr:hypothetical protein [Alistipes sp.]